eukprot:14064958-Ditylum_brightwellii.AAC.1
MLENSTQYFPTRVESETYIYPMFSGSNYSGKNPKYHVCIMISAEMWEPLMNCSLTILKCRQCQTVETTQLNDTPYDDEGTKTVRFEIPPSNVPHSEEKGGEHLTTSSCAIDQLQHQPATELSLEEITNSEENGTEQVDPNIPAAATNAAIKQTLEVNNEFLFSPDEGDKEPTLVERN